MCPDRRRLERIEESVNFLLLRAFFILKQILSSLYTCLLFPLIAYGLFHVIKRAGTFTTVLLYFPRLKLSFPSLSISVRFGRQARQACFLLALTKVCTFHREERKFSQIASLLEETD